MGAPTEKEINAFKLMLLERADNPDAFEELFRMFLSAVREVALQDAIKAICETGIRNNLARVLGAVCELKRRD